ncbi:hypothetical protein ACHAQJ_009282 [Trichoderma viride]
MRETWSPFLLGPEDDWSKVANGEDRKRIQNRLSQRARRAHLKAKRSTPKTESTTANAASPSESPSGTTASSSSKSSFVDDNVVGSLFPPADEDNTAYSLPAISELDTDEEISADPSPTEISTTALHYSTPLLRTPPPYLDSSFIVLASTNTVSAYTSNAVLLQISCATTHPRTFDVLHSPTPTSLEPTLLQKTIPHPPFVDIIPFPGVRNRLIRSLDVIDLAKLSQDLVQDAFRVWGQAAWDGTGWEVSETFARRWWFLMDEQLINVTNFWRRQRLEGPLLMSSGEVSVEA